jgi:hypothetical protein
MRTGNSTRAAYLTDYLSGLYEIPLLNKDLTLVKVA